MKSPVAQAANKHAGRLGPGGLVLVVGPSGAGKDTLIRLAQTHFGDDGRVLFGRRLITRGPDPFEDHDPIDVDTLRTMVTDGNVAMSWSAHGLDYALPLAIDHAIAAGRTVVVNVSRRIIVTALAKYEHVITVLVSVPADILADRLRIRGRETSADVAERLQRRADDGFPDGANVTVIDNSGEPAHAAARLIALIDRLAQSTPADGITAELPQRSSHF